MRRLAGALVLALLCAGSSSAQERSAPAVLVRAGNLFDSESGRMVGARDILVREGVIAAVAPRLETPPGAELVDLRRCAVLPGLIDAHTHLLTEEIPGEDPALTAAREQAGARAFGRSKGPAGRAAICRPGSRPSATWAIPVAFSTWR